MSVLKQNRTMKKGKYTTYNYYLQVQLPTGKERITLPDTKDDKVLANTLKRKADEVEKRARLFPGDRDWLVMLYKALGLEHKIPTYSANCPTIKQAWELMIADKTSTKQVKSKSTLDMYGYSLLLVLSGLGDIPINAISPLHKPKLQTRINRVAKDSAWADTTINFRIKYINAFLNWCLEEQYIDKLPFKLKKVQVVKSKKTWIRIDEFNEICRFVNPNYLSHIKVAYHTGLRLRELTTDPNDKAYKGLYHTLDRADNQWRLQVTGKMGDVKPTILPEEVKADYDIMVANRFNPHTISKQFKKACIKAGYPQYNFHHTRHSKAHNTVEKGDIYTASAMMRHKSIKTTEGYLNDERLSWVKQVESMNIIA